MSAGPAARFAARIVFVVGKGGVGKTTTAGALAVAFADRGEATHLVSTDPAHSLGDLFGSPLPGGRPAPCGCAPGLALEELDAPAYGRSWLAGVAPALLELVERGTYLDAEDVRGFLDLSLPGVDEVMAALRLAELAEGPAERVVVDTAPTGHTLRLLDAGAVLAGWTAAFRAMAAKAGAVASAFARRPVRFEAEEALDRLDARVDAFRRGVLPTASFVLAARPGAVVEAETARLAGELRRRGLLVAGTVVAAGEALDPGAFPPPVFRLPRRPGVSGCAALRELLAAAERVDASDPVPAGGGPGVRPESAAAAAVGPGPAEGRPEAAPPAAADAGPTRLPAEAAPPAAAGAAAWFRASGRELLLFAGKGGVGKTTCAAACALALAEAGPVRLFSTDPAGSLGDVLGIEVPPGGARPVPGLEVRQVDAAAELERLRERYREDVDRVFARLGLGGSAELDRRVVASLWELAPPGMDEVFALGAMLEAGRGGTLVIDSAPTGHFLRLVEMPAAALEWTHALLRVFLKYRAALGLEEAARELLDFARRLRRLGELLADPARTAAVVVTMDEPLVHAETERLRAALEAARIPIGAVVVNRAGGRAGPPAGWPGRAWAAPALPRPPVGTEALRAFLDRWEDVG